MTWFAYDWHKFDPTEAGFYGQCERPSCPADAGWMFCVGGHWFAMCTGCKNQFERTGVIS